MPAPSPIEYPYLVVGTLEIFFAEGGQQKKWVGTGYLIQTAQYERRDVVLTAAHNLVYLQQPGLEEVHFTLYKHRDVYTIGRRQNGSLRYAIPPVFQHGTTVTDFAVMVLAEAAPIRLAPLPLTIVGADVNTPGVVAGCISREVAEGNRTIYRSEVQVKKELTTALYYDKDATQKGMSGGPVLVHGDAGWSTIGIVGGTGDVHGTEHGLAAPILKDTAVIIDDLIATSLAG